MEGGHIRQFMSIGEGSDKGLNIIPYAGTFVENAVGDQIGIDSVKISVHPSPNSSGYTIKRSDSYRDGDLHEDAVVLKDAKAGFVWPLLARLSPRMDFPPSKFKSKPKDHIVYMGHYDPERRTLIYLVVITDLGHHHFDQSVTGWFRAVDFGLFRVVVFPSYAHVPATLSGSTIDYGRGKLRINKAPLSLDDRTYVDPMTSKDIRGILWNTMVAFRPKILSHVFRYYGSGPELQQAILATSQLRDRPIEIGD